ncbi:MAG: FtsW/RodA/SpoVE family cell cycle protein, partial [Chloroflexota bacterium]
MNTLVNIRPRVPLGSAPDPVRRRVDIRPRGAAQLGEAGAPSAPHAPDYTLVVITLALLCIGVVMVYSASLMAAYKAYNDQAYFFQRQLIWCTLGLVVMLLLTRVPYYAWRRFSIVALLGSVALLVAVFLPGLSGHALGATRWIEVHNIKIGQPSELIKITLVLYMADWLARKGERVRELAYGLAPFAIILCLILGLIIKQPDMGTAIVIGATAFAIFFVSGASLRQLLPLTLLGAAGFLVLALESKYRQGRLSSFMNPWSDPTNTGYHVVQSLIALGDGGIRR